MKKTLSLIGTFLLGMLCFAQEKSTVRIGWQVPWATQGQLVQVLKHTDTLAENGLEASFIGKTYGPELNELALANQIDVVLTGDQPGIALLSKNKGWVIIGRLMYNRTSIYVPLKSKINTINDLKGKTIGLPFGAAAERTTKESLKAKEIDPTKDVMLKNLGMLEHTPLILKYKNKSKWGSFDALSGFDPIPAVLETKELVKTIDVGKVVSLIIVKEDLLKADPSIKDKILNSFIDAYDFLRTDINKANKWFCEEAKFDDPEFKACEIAASIEPNIKAKTKEDIRVTFNEDDLERLQSVVTFMEPTTKVNFKITDYIY